MPRHTSAIPNNHKLSNQIFDNLCEFKIRDSSEPVEGTGEWRYTLVDLFEAGILDSNLNVIPDPDSEWEEYR